MPHVGDALTLGDFKISVVKALTKRRSVVLIEKVESARKRTTTARPRQTMLF